MVYQPVSSAVVSTATLEFGFSVPTADTEANKRSPFKQLPTSSRNQMRCTWSALLRGLFVLDLKRTLGGFFVAGILLNDLPWNGVICASGTILSSLCACDDRRHNDAVVSLRSDHALFLTQARDLVFAMHKLGFVELLLPYG